MKKAIVVLVVLFNTGFGLSVFQSCNKNPCGDGPLIPSTTYIDSIKCSVQIIDSILNIGNTGYLVLTSANNSAPVNYDSVILQLDHIMKRVAGRIAIRNSFGFNAAYACPPPEEIQDYINDITITSSESYNDSLPAGADLKRLMLVHPEKIKDGIDLETILKQHNPIYSNELYLSFAYPPKEEKAHNITITYFAKSRKVAATINNVRIRK